MELHAIEQSVFFQFFADDGESVFSAINRNVEIGDDVRNRSDVIFVRMRENDGANHALVLFQIGGVGNDDVNAEEFLLGEHEARIDDDDVVAGAENEHVHSKFAEPAERDGPYRGLAQFFSLSLVQKVLARGVWSAY